MADLLKELEAVVAAQSNPKEWIKVALKFMDTHHAEIADVVRDARRYRAAIQRHKDEFPDEPLNGELTLWADLDAHNSAREAGE
jgi:hypothetical protein